MQYLPVSYDGPHQKWHMAQINQVVRISTKQVYIQQLQLTAELISNDCGRCSRLDDNLQFILTLKTPSECAKPYFETSFYRQTAVNDETQARSIRHPIRIIIIYYYDVMVTGQRCYKNQTRFVVASTVHLHLFYVGPSYIYIYDMKCKTYSFHATPP